MKRILAAALAALLFLATAAVPALSPGVVWPHLPAGIASTDYVATCVGGLLAQIDAATLPASDPDDLSTFYYLPAPSGPNDAAWWARFNLIVADWKQLSDANRAKIRFRIY